MKVLEKDAGREAVWAVGPSVAVTVKDGELILHVALSAQRRSVEPRCPHERTAIPLPHAVRDGDVAKLDVSGALVTLGTKRGDLFYLDMREPRRWWPFGNAFGEGR